MASALQRFTFLLGILAGTIHLSIQDEECVPGTVQNLTLTANSTLNWVTPNTEQCSIAAYLVEVALQDGTLQWSYTTQDTTVDVGHLEPCQTYFFRVFQVSTDNITGSGWTVYANTPPNSDVDLELAYVNHTQVGHTVRLEWGLAPQHAHCARRYRVVIYVDETNVAFDQYTTLTAMNINNLIPCTNYTFAVRALFTLIEDGPATLVEHRTYDDINSRPELISVTPDRNKVTLVWQLQEYSRNRCHISSLHLNGSPNFDINLEIPDQTNRNPFPVTIDNLAAAGLYYLRTSVVNSAGESAPFLMAVQTLE
ncbi:hypothetical protein NQ318_017901 [Aromia moschata]|uniref:Fibronectin type-III domain-containing protein n=1 Tax=Aromia moschata TaxID=1265417 RepID=A0AAV8YD13_9CUCU|nr:hypothetical protein NQ318_017901 [Aromia moschata]